MLANLQGNREQQNAASVQERRPSMCGKASEAKCCATSRSKSEKQYLEAIMAGSRLECIALGREI